MPLRSLAAVSDTDAQEDCHYRYCVDDAMLTNFKDDCFRMETGILQVMWVTRSASQNCSRQKGSISPSPLARRQAFCPAVLRPLLTLANKRQNRVPRAIQSPPWG